MSASSKNQEDTNIDAWRDKLSVMPCYAFAGTSSGEDLVTSKLFQDLLTTFPARKPGISLLFGESNKNELELAFSRAEKKGSASCEICVTAEGQDPLFFAFSISAFGPVFVGFGQDVTDYKMREQVACSSLRNMEQKLQEQTRDLALARDRAMAASRAKSGFLANMSHELRTPLNAIIGYSEILQEDMSDGSHDQWIADLKKVHGAGKHLLSLINDILDLSKIEAGKMGLNLEYFQVEHMIEDVLETIKPLAMKNRTEIKHIENDMLGVMLADITKVRQIMFNLLSNAIKFTEEGTVTVITSRTKREDKDCLVFEVIDTGLGMTEDEVNKIFQEFFQAENEASKKWGGTGLGLVISQRFAQMMGGDITVSSVMGQGSKFTVIVPVNTAKLRFQDSPDGFNVGPKVDPRLVRFSGNAKDVERRSDISKVLVIDDDPSVRDLMERYLSREGFEVRSSPSGQEGINILKEYRPDVITLDVLMPVMDGWSVLSELKKNPDTAEIPVIMLSMMDELEMSFALGASDYLLKPIQKDVLVATVLKHLRGDSNGKVLVVDDKAENRNVITRILTAQGIGSVEAENGCHALEVMESVRPNLILLDLMMPKMDGFRFSEEVKQRKDWQDIPIVVITARELTTEDLKRLSSNVEKVYERKGMDFESFLFDIQSMVTRTVRESKKKV